MQTAIFQSRFARRVFALFVLSAVIPILVIAAVTWGHVRDVVATQAAEQLLHAARGYAGSLHERLHWLERNLRDASVAQRAPSTLDTDLRNRFAAVEVVYDDAPTAAAHSATVLPELTLSQQLHLASGGTLLFVERRQRDIPGIGMIQLLDPGAQLRGYIVATVEPSYLWGDLDLLPYGTDFCVIDHAARPLFCTADLWSAVLAGRLTDEWSRTPSTGGYEFHDGSAPRIAHVHSLELDARFAAGGWAVVASQPRSLALAAVNAFQKLFPAALAVALAIIALLTVIQIRRRVVPLERLIEGTRRLAAGEFATRFDTRASDDEFGELAESMNAMTERLGRQFRALGALSEIDRLILSSSVTERIIARVLLGLRDVCDCDQAIIVVPHGNDGSVLRVHHMRRGEGAVAGVIEAAAVDGAWASLARDLSDSDDDRVNNVIESLARVAPPMRCIHIQQVHVGDNLAAVIVLAGEGGRRVPEEQRQHVLRFADRVAVALAAVDRERRLYEQTHYDVLTGLPNRQLLRDRLAQELLHARRTGSHAGVLYIDLDRFKSVNDRYGHAAGDRLLDAVGQRIRAAVRSADTVARPGGDEFVVVLSRLDEPHHASLVAESLQRLFAEPFEVGGRERLMGLSIGIAVFPDDGAEADELLRNADTAMYAAKGRGRGTFSFFRSEMNEQVLERIALEDDLRRALDRDELQLHYQPQLRLSDDCVVGAEALLRWRHPKRGWVDPAVFIPLAEDLGIIDIIGDWVLRTACAQWCAWRDAGLRLPRVAVNVSARQFRQAGFLPSVRQALAHAAMTPAALELEITESTAMEDAERTAGAVRALRTIGVRLAIDDFGTGYSSLSYLRRFRVDALKVDRSFIAEMMDNNDVRAIVDAIVGIAHTMRMDVIAEGIESDAQRDYLRVKGCDHGQGFFLARPMDSEAFRVWLSAHDRGLFDPAGVCGTLR